MNTVTFINRQQSNRRLARILCIGLLMQGLAGCKDAQKPYPGAGESFPLSALAQMTRVGNSDIDIEGKTLLINFWATWCAPCRKEMPALQKLSDNLDPELYAVIGISVDEDRNLIKEFMLQYGIRFPVLQDDKLRLASELLRINTFPETFIVSPRGVISRRISEALPLDFSIVDQSAESREPTNTVEYEPGIKG